MRFFKQALFSAIIVLVSATAQAAVVSTIGGQNADKNYHFVVTQDSSGDAIMTSGSDSTVQLTAETEIITTATTASPLALTSARKGKVLIAIVGAKSDFTLPDCESDQMEYNFVAGDANTLTIDVASGDTINFRGIDAGDAIDSSGTIGDSITLSCYTDDTWIPTAISDIANWTDGGAN
jgi:hypothetical protein